MLGSALSNRKDRTITLLAPNAPPLLPDEQRSQQRTHAWLLMTPHDGMGENTSEECGVSVRVGAEQQEGADHHASPAHTLTTAPDAPHIERDMVSSALHDGAPS